MASRLYFLVFLPAVFLLIIGFLFVAYDFNQFRKVEGEELTMQQYAALRVEAANEGAVISDAIEPRISGTPLEELTMPTVGQYLSAVIGPLVSGGPVLLAGTGPLEQHYPDAPENWLRIDDSSAAFQPVKDALTGNAARTAGETLEMLAMKTIRDAGPADPYGEETIYVQGDKFVMLSGHILEASSVEMTPTQVRALDNPREKFGSLPNHFALIDGVRFIGEVGKDSAKSTRNLDAWVGPQVRLNVEFGAQDSEVFDVLASLNYLGLNYYNDEPTNAITGDHYLLLSGAILERAEQPIRPVRQEHPEIALSAQDGFFGFGWLFGKDQAATGSGGKGFKTGCARHRGVKRCKVSGVDG